MEENTIEQLVNKINELEEELKRTKKYGLVWDKEHVPENRIHHQDPACCHGERNRACNTGILMTG